jgi:hypothetical protein
MNFKLQTSNLKPQTKKTCRSVSRILYPPKAGHYHLSAMTIAGHLDLPTHSRLRHRRIERAAQKRDIFGISARKVYPNLTFQ